MTSQSGVSGRLTPLLDTLCPMHVRVDEFGKIVHAGPTVVKMLGSQSVIGEGLFDYFEVLRPRSISSLDELRKCEGRKLHLRLKTDDDAPLKAVIANCPDKSAILNLSFGIHVLDAAVDYSLTSTDFAPTDLAMELLYLVEAQSAAMNETRLLNRRLQGAKMAAERRADTDALTGLRNRGAMNKVLERLISAGQPFSMLHVDLDYFKQINDGFGHAAGDWVLQEAARIMLSLTRKDDLAARVGGDEFVIILSGLCNAARIRQIAGALIAALEEEIFHGDEHLNVSASIGISSVTQVRKSAEELLEEADIALYASKRAGRARYTFFKPGMSQAADI